MVQSLVSLLLVTVTSPHVFGSPNGNVKIDLVQMFSDGNCIYPVSLTAYNFSNSYLQWTNLEPNSVYPAGLDLDTVPGSCSDSPIPGVASGQYNCGLYNDPYQGPNFMEFGANEWLTSEGCPGDNTPSQGSFFTGYTGGCLQGTLMVKNSAGWDVYTSLSGRISCYTVPVSSAARAANNRIWGIISVLFVLPLFL